MTDPSPTLFFRSQRPTLVLPGRGVHRREYQDARVTGGLVTTREIYFKNFISRPISKMLFRCVISIKSVAHAEPCELLQTGRAEGVCVWPSGPAAAPCHLWLWLLHGTTHLCCLSFPEALPMGPMQPSRTWEAVAQPSLGILGRSVYLEGTCPQVPGTVTGDPSTSASGQ